MKPLRDVKKDSSYFSLFYGFYIFFNGMKIFLYVLKIIFNAYFSKIILSLVSLKLNRYGNYRIVQEVF